MTPREILEAENEVLLMELGHWRPRPIRSAPQVRVGDCLIDTDSPDDDSTVDLPDDEPAFIEDWDDLPEYRQDWDR